MNEPVLVLVTFEDCDPLEESSSSPADANHGLDIEKDKGGKGGNNSDDLDDYGVEEDLDN